MSEPAEHWHLKKEITWGHIITTMGLLGVVLSQYISMTNAIADIRNEARQNRVEIEHVKEIGTMQNMRMDSAIEEVKRKFDQINNKLEVMQEFLLKQTHSRQEGMR